MKKPNFRNMSPEEFKAYRPRTEGEIAACEAEAKFRKWCEQNEEDPMDEGAYERYEEIEEEYGEKFWDNMDPNDRAGHEDNMNKD